MHYVLTGGSLNRELSKKHILNFDEKKKQFAFNVHKKSFSNNVFIETMFDGWREEIKMSD